jgi:hypothetical protein
MARRKGVSVPDAGLPVRPGTVGPNAVDLSSELERVLTTHPDGAVIAVLAIPCAGRSAIERVDGDVLHVRLAALPVDGAANAALFRVLADALAVPRAALRLLSGQTTRRQRVLVAGVTTADVAASLLSRLSLKEQRSPCAREEEESS